MSRASLQFRRLGVRALFALACALPSTVFADELPRTVAAASNPAASPSPPIQYRRIYVPAGKMDAWPRDGEKLIPIDSRDFDAWIHSANESATGQKNYVATSAAEYSARLETGGQLHGKGRWTIVLRGDKPAFLPLGDMSLVLRNPHWQNLPQHPARIGTWGQNNHFLGRFGLEVVRSGTLEFDWHVETRSTDDEIAIPWRVPEANSVRLTLDLAEGKQPRIEGGVVLESTLIPSEDKTAGKPRRRWVIALTPAQATSLRIVSADRKPSEPAAQTVLREEVSYHIGPRGLEMAATWNLIVPADQKRELNVAVPPGLQLSSIKADDGDLTWRLIRDSSTPTDTALVDLPKSDNSKPLQITFNAWQPLVAGAPWRLPRLRSEGVFWSSGKLELSIAATHELGHLNLTDCVETSVGQLNASEESPETHSFAAYSSSAALEINLSERQTDTTIRAGSSLALADPNLNGRLVTQLKLSHGSTHQFVGNVAPGWIVEALETIPADAMTEWFIDRHGNEQQIEIQLSQAASAARNVTVILTARLQRFNLTERLSAETMRMVRWNGAKTAQHLLTFQSNEPYAVVPVGKLTEVAADAIDANDRSLLDPATDNKVYDITDAGANSGLQFALRRGQFAAHIDLETTYENESLRQEYRLTAEPASGPIDRILVYATGPMGDSTRWVDKATNTPVAAEKLVANDPQRANLPKEGEVWLLRFPQPTTRPIELIAAVNIKRPERALVPLLFLPDATQQEARILVRCRNQSALWLEPIHLQTIPLPPNALSASEPNSLPPACAAYRYQPADCRDPALAPKLLASAISESKTIPLIARHIELESYVWPDGSGAHCATYQLDNHGAADVKLVLPAEALLVSASLDGQSLDIAKPTNTSQPALIRLSAQTRATKLSLYLETSGPSLAAGCELTPPTILKELPFVSGNWTIWLPEEYSATGAGLSAAAPSYNWRERFFGVLGRPAGSRPFNPFRLADGAALVNGLANGNMSGSPTDASKDQTLAQKLDQNKTTVANPVASSARPTAGWRSYHESFITSGPAPIVVLHPPAITAWTVVLLLACFLCGRWIRRFHPEAFAVALAAAAASGLLLPVAHANLASGAVLGLLLSLIADWPRPSIFGEESLRRPRPNSAITVALVVVVATGIAKLSHAESLPTKNAASDALLNKIYRLLIPTDEHGHPVGTKYYVSDEFLRTLIAAASDSSQNLGQWLLNDATFSGELVEKMGQKDVIAGNWTMTFSIETLARDTTVVLPLLRSDADWSATAMLDGVPSLLEWRDAGRGCAIQVPEPGRYSLALSCVPKTRTTDGLNQIDLAIPPIAGAKIEVRYPEGTSAVTVANASLLTPLSGSANALQGELDRTNRLNVHWSRTDKLENGASGFSLAELRWLHITPTELEITVKYILEGGARRPDSIAVAYGNRWKLLTTEKSLNAKNAVSDTTGQHIIRIPISTQATDRQEIFLRWRLVDPPALGNLRLPPIELTSLSLSKRWLAISTDSTLDCEIADASATESTANEYFAKWGDADANDPPQTVLSNFDSRRASTIAIRPRETEPIVDESLNVSAGLTALRVNYEARTTPGISGTYQTDLSVPADLSIDEIEITEADRPIPLRWSRTAKNRVTVFFSQQITKPYRFVLDGTMPVDANGKAILPHISTLATEDATEKIRLYRNDDVRVELDGLPSATDPKADAPGPPPSQWSARPVATCYLESDFAAARIIVKPNKFKIVGDSLTTLTRENGAWSVNYRCQLSVEEGDLDNLRLRIPNTCTGPFDVQSAFPVTTEFKPVDDQTGILSVRFATSVAKGGSVDLRIRSPLKPPIGTAVSVPTIVIESLASGRRYISVPDTVDSQAVAWSETGVRRATVPPKLRTGSPPSMSSASFDIVSDPFQVASRSSATPELSPQIRLADTAIVTDDLGAQRIATRLILATQDLSDCTLQLPANQSLVTVELDGRPAVIRQIDQSQWQVALGAALPQSLEIVSRSTANDVNVDSAELQRPALLARGKPIPAEISLWSFAHPRKSASRVVTGADEVTAVDQSALRFDRLVSIAEAAKATAADLPTPDGYYWFQPWAQLLTAARTQTQQARTVPQLERPESQVSHAAEDQISQAAARLDKWLDDCRRSLVGPNSETGPLSSGASKSPTSTRPIAPATDEWTFYVAEGGNDRLALHLQPVGPTSSQIRLIGLLLIAACLVAAIWLMRRPAAIDALCRWPHAVGVLVGIGYWAWMWPSWLGILIAAAGVWLALRFDWPGRSLRTEASTVLRASRTT